VCQRQALTVYKEPAKYGQWYHCTGCGFAGDGVELTAAVGEISPGSALLKLAARGLPIPEEILTPAEVDRYVKKVEFRKRVLAFWEKARTNTDDIGNTGPAQRRLGIAPGAMHSPEWPKRGGRFVGHCKHIDVEELLRPAVMNYRHKVGRNSTGNVGWCPLFVGRGWGDLLVIPYQDVPGRISGLLVVGREAVWPTDFVFAHCTTAGRPWATGIAMFDAAVPLHHEFGDTVFVLEDPVLAVRIQLRHLASSDVPLPLVGSWGSPEMQSIWTARPKRNLVHWSPEPDGKLIARARLSGGRVALAPTGTAVAGHLERCRPTLALQNMLAAAKPWDDSLEVLLGQLAPAKAEEMVLGLKLKPDETSSFLRACADDTRVRLAALFTDAGKPRGVTISGKTVTESGGAWRVAKTGELVLDAVLRIEQVIRSASGSVSYRGRIEYKGQSVPFWAPDKEIEKDTMRWIRTKVGQAGLGEVILGSIFWSRHLMGIAQQLEPPQAVRGLDVVGWDDARNAFALPKFVLHGNGDIVAPDYVVPPEAIIPGAGLAPPEALTPRARVDLVWGDTPNELFWAAATCLLTDILAPALGLPRSSIALVGDGAIGVGAATALAFGCITAKIPTEYNTVISMHTYELLSAHRWPTLMRRPDAPTATLNARGIAQFPNGIVAAVTSLAADTLALTGGWHVITGNQPASTARAAEHGATILRAYLKDICDRRLTLEVTSTLLDAVHADLVAWYGRVAAPRAVIGSRKYICADDPSEHPNRFGRLVCRLIACGELRLAQPGTNNLKVIARLGDDRVHIPKWSFNESLTKKHAIALDADAISTRLRAAGILLEEREQDYTPGWVVSERWLRQFTDGRQQDDKNDFSVVT
jgi:hypothetical protein